MNKHLLTLLVLLAGGSLATAQTQTNTNTSTNSAVPTIAPNHEPTNDAEVQAQNKYLDKINPQEYAKWDAYVKSRPAEEQVWLKTLEDQLGSFYGPPYMKDLINNKVNPATDGWGYVKDDPKLPRVLIIGDSISRSYTADARAALAGKANVHRAPANCGRTEYFFKNGEIWLNQNGSNKWDLITVNFGIHDNAKTPEWYTANMKAIIKRLHETGATILLVNTTPWSKKEDPAGTDRSIPVNEAMAKLAKEENIELINLHDAILPYAATLQGKDHVHFGDEGAKKMGQALAAAIEPHLKKAN